MDSEDILKSLKAKGQEELLGAFHALNPEKRAEFLASLRGLDLDLAFRLHGSFREEKKESAGVDLCPAPIIPIPGTSEEMARRREAVRVGESLIRRNEVAVLIVAGGQGTRLGFAGPKGKFPVSPVRKKPLFRLFAESLVALSLRHHAVIPLLIMTSVENHEETRRFFEAENFFGLDRAEVHFFNQGMLPSLSPEGKLLLRSDCELLCNPDGHGGSLKALHDSGILKRLLDRGTTELFYCQVDNPLAKIADPAFIGYHRQGECDISTKVVRRQNLQEKVGIYGLVDGKPAVVEYSDCRPEDYGKVDENGAICYWAGNVAIHMISLPFVERLNRQGFALPYHRAVKEVECLGADGKPCKLSAWKFETFVFDSIRLANKTCCMEVKREEEFSPVKNQTGIDSPATARKAMSYLFRSWLIAAGAEVAPEAQVEISPLFALDREELIEKLRGKRVAVREDTYFGE